jgi:pyruvate, water dikinase
MRAIIKAMKYVQSLDKLRISDVSSAGGKGASLGDMIQAGFNVPSGFVVLAKAFTDFLEEKKVQPEIEQRFSDLNIKDINSVNRMSRVIMDMIIDINLSAELEEEIFQCYNSLKNRNVAVRSSATAEDSKVASWAGELETYLNVTEEDLLRKTKACWASLYTPRAIFYRYEQGLAERKVLVAVVVQEMIPSEKAGVAFTVHPISKDKNQLLIEAGYGLGEVVVSGMITPDTYVIDKAKLQLIDIDRGVQKKKIVPTKTGTRVKEISNDVGGKQKLNEDEIIKLSQVCLDIEKHFGFPCDIEWALVGGRFYVTQSRPITTL